MLALACHQLPSWASRMESLRRARLGALAMDDGMCTRQAAADCFRAVGVDVRPAQGVPAPVEEYCDRGTAGRYPVAAVGGRSFSGRCGVARPGGTRLSGRAAVSYTHLTLQLN